MPVQLIAGKDSELVSRETAKLKALVRRAQPQAEITVLAAEALDVAQFLQLVSPSLFALPRLIVLQDVQNLPEAVGEALVSYACAPETDTWLVLTHDGGVKGKKLLGALAQAQVPKVQVVAPKNANERKALLVAEVRARGGRIEPEAAQLIVDALGESVGELLGAAEQLAQDFPSLITFQQASDYFGARLGANAYAIADEMVRGRAGAALVLLRRALAQGEAPLKILGALVMKVRVLCKVSGSRSLSPAQLGMAPWQVDAARSEVRNWTDARLSRALAILSRADWELKGGAKSPVYALEAAVREVALLRAEGDGRR